MDLKALLSLVFLVVFFGGGYMLVNDFPRRDHIIAMVVGGAAFIGLLFL